MEACDAIVPSAEYLRGFKDGEKQARELQQCARYFPAGQGEHGHVDLIDRLTARLQYLLIEEGEGKITDMRVLAEDLLYIAAMPEPQEVVKLTRLYQEALQKLSEVQAELLNLRIQKSSEAHDTSAR